MNWRIPGDGSASAALVHDGVVSGDADATGFRPKPPAWESRHRSRRWKPKEQRPMA